MNRENLAKLADYLDTLPDDYAAFEMNSFFEGENAANYALHNGGVDKCGAVACAVGHGPSAGFLMPANLVFSGGYVAWPAYCTEFFVTTGSNEFEWMFGGAWSEVDNTPSGAAKRIRWLLNGGLIPLEWDDYYEEDRFRPDYSHLELYA